MTTQSDIISARREAVMAAYNAAKAENRQRFLEGDVKATAEYIFPNQIADACAIVSLFYEKNCRVVSVPKKTKVGADGLMIELAKLLTTHHDDNFVVNPSKLRIITGMSNAGWEKDMIEKAPSCFKGCIFHHGKLTKAELMGLRDSLIIIDEIDSGNKEQQRLHNTLKDADILNVEYMIEHNIRFVLISATMVKELYDLYQWGDLHELHKMTIPASYIGHKEFLERGIVREFYALDKAAAAEKWIEEDILAHYGDDYRVNIVRVNPKTVDIVRDACIRKKVVFRNHTSDERLSEDETDELFQKPLTRHIVLGVKGFFRRANLIPNEWKLRIGATHELYTKKVDNNVQVQGLPGRMTGYWRDMIEAGHKTGPHRTSLKALKEYERVYEDPLGNHSYQSSGFKMRAGRVHAGPTMLSAKNIANLTPVESPVALPQAVDINLYRIYDNEEVVKAVCRLLKYHYRPSPDNEHGFKETSLNNKRGVASLADAIKKVPTAYGTNNGKRTYRTYYPCYVNTTDASTLRFVVIIRPEPETDIGKLAECDALYPTLGL